MLLSTAHFPPIQYFTKIIRHDSLIIEACENYQRQSYRNRFRILAANGPVDLSVPVVKGHSSGMPVKSVRIDYSENWQRIHFKTIESAYRHSPFYEFYIDDFLSFWEKQQTFLYDLNLNILNTLVKVLDLDLTIRETREYLPESAGLTEDYRNSIHPKKEWTEDISFSPSPYIQNFPDRFGFIPNLSIIDLIFQAGPEAGTIIRKSIS